MNQDQRHALELRHAREDEQRRIAGELHKGIAQTLAALRVQLNVAENQLKEDPHARRGFSGLRPLVAQSLTELQDLIESLRPAIPDGVGLPAALRAYLSFVATRTGKDIRLYIDEPFPALLLPIESTVYQMIKDILSLDCEPSGGLTSLDIKLERQMSLLHVHMQGWDTGVRASLHSESVIFSRIRDRAKALGGTCLMCADEDSSGTIVMTLPLLLRETEETVS